MLWLAQFQKEKWRVFFYYYALLKNKNGVPSVTKMHLFYVTDQFVFCIRKHSWKHLFNTYFGEKERTDRIP